MKLLCAVVGHRWSETHTGEAVLRCSRCGLVHELSDDEAPNYGGIARTYNSDP